VSGILGQARRSVAAVPAARRAGADSLLRLADEDVELVRRGRGAHNIVFADKLLLASVELARDAVGRSGASYRVPEAKRGGPVAGNECLSCHLGVEGTRVAFAGTTFDHEPHVAEAGLACTNCHTGLDSHGGTTVNGRAGCESCHHRGPQAGACANCHGTGPSRVIAQPTGPFSHPVHAASGVACRECHTPPSMTPRSGVCETCHERHHVPSATCLSCHKGGVKAIHPRAAHDGCAACHGPRLAGITEWSREVCTVCHVDRVDHNAPMKCENCHRIPPLARGGS
jgi:hypothetical protein